MDLQKFEAVDTVIGGKIARGELEDAYTDLRNFKFALEYVKGLKTDGCKKYADLALALAKKVEKVDPTSIKMLEKLKEDAAFLESKYRITPYVATLYLEAGNLSLSIYESKRTDRLIQEVL